METTAAGRIGAVDLSLAEIVRASQDGIALVWGDRIEWVNAALVAMLHVPANHLEGMLLDELEVLAAVPLQRRILLGDLRPDAGSVTGDLVRRTGSPLPVSIEASGLGLGADGRYAVTFRRLTPLVRAVQEAQVAQGQFEAMANHAPNGVFSSGHGLRLEYVNQRFASLFGEDAAALLDLGYSAGDRASLEDDLLGKAFAAGRRIWGCPVAGRFIDIGIPDDYRRAASVFARGEERP